MQFKWEETWFMNHGRKEGLEFDFFTDDMENIF